MTIQDFTPDRTLINHFKLGTLVVFKDNSYVTDINGSSSHPTLDAELGIFKIIDCNKPFPTATTHQFCCPINNMKVQNIKTGKIYHCSNINVYSISCGKSNEQDTVNYKGRITAISQVFSNPFPFI